MRDEKKSFVLHKVFVDIAHGFSVLHEEENLIYVKHFSLGDQVELDSFYQEVFDKAAAQGLPTEQDRLDFLREEGLWTADKEDSIATKKAYIKGLEGSLGKLVIKAQQDSIRKSLEQARGALEELLQEREELLLGTCEKYASNKLNNFVLYKSLFKESDCVTPYFSAAEFDELGSMELVKWLKLYAAATHELTLDNIKDLAVSGSFSNYFNICADNASAFFPKQIYEWTFFQVNLINYGKVFKNILENIKDIPEHIKDDPDALMEYATQESKRAEYQQNSDGKDAYSVVGASREDMDKMGVKPKGGVDLHKYASQRGDSLTMKDFIDMQNG